MNSKPITLAPAPRPPDWRGRLGYAVGRVARQSGRVVAMPAARPLDGWRAAPPMGDPGSLAVSPSFRQGPALFPESRPVGPPRRRAASAED